MPVTEKITKRIKTLTIRGRTITLNENEDIGQAIATLQNPTANGGGREIRREEENSQIGVEGAE